MILLDTNAVLWLQSGNKRTARLRRTSARLYVSPATLLELQFLVEIGKLRLKAGATPADLLSNDGWLADEPPAGAWFEKATELSWTRDPFDRLIAAHAILRNWKLATSDERLIAHLGKDGVIEL